MQLAFLTQDIFSIKYFHILFEAAIFREHYSSLRIINEPQLNSSIWLFFLECTKYLCQKKKTKIYTPVTLTKTKLNNLYYQFFRYHLCCDKIINFELFQLKRILFSEQNVKFALIFCFIYTLIKDVTIKYLLLWIFTNMVKICHFY